MPTVGRTRSARVGGQWSKSLQPGFETSGAEEVLRTDNCSQFGLWDAMRLKMGVWSCVLLEDVIWINLSAFCCILLRWSVYAPPPSVTYTVYVCVCVCSAQMELLIEACAVDHWGTHYGNFQLEEPASVRVGSAAGRARAWLPTPAPLGRRPTQGSVQRTAVFIQHSSPGTRFHSLKPIFDYRRLFSLT